jgi:hypothetical protein
MGRKIPVSAENPSGLGDATVAMSLTLSTETEATIERLAREIHGTKADAFAWGLALLELAVQAWSDGKRLAIVDQQGGLVTEITGH